MIWTIPGKRGCMKTAGLYIAINASGTGISGSKRWLWRTVIMTFFALYVLTGSVDTLTPLDLNRIKI